MFIVSKEVMKDIVEFGKKWQEDIKNEDSLSALMAFFLAPLLIFFIIFAFLGDIVFSPLETIIYLQVRKVKNERNK
jgi:hypothetical protein